MKRWLYILLNALAGIFAVLGWVILLAGNNLSPLPFGAVAGIAMAVFSVSAPFAVLSVVLCALFYSLWFVALFFAKKGKRWAMIAGTFTLCFDMAASVVFTIFSWWFLAGVILDAAMTGLLWWMCFPAKKEY